MRYPICHIYRHQDDRTPRSIEGFYPPPESPGWAWWLVGGLLALLFVAATVVCAS